MSILQREVLSMALVVIFFNSIIVLPVGASLAPGGSIQINSTPSGATVCADNGYCQVTPAYFRYLTAGFHIIFVTLSGYQPHMQQIFVGLGPSPADSVVNINLKPDVVPSGSIHVNTTPSNATVCVKYGNCKPSPVTFDNLSGNNYHLLTISQGDYRVWNDNVMVLPRTTTDVNEVLQPYNTGRTGYIQVNISPPHDSIICFDSHYCEVDKTPNDMNFRAEANKSHTITVVGDNYRIFSTEIFVPENQAKEVKIDLQPITIPVGNIQINTTVAGGTVCLDGIRCDTNIGSIGGFGNTRFVDVDATTRHTITVNTTGYQPYSTQVTVGEGQTTVLDVQLQPVAPAPTKTKLNAFVALGAIVICCAILWRMKKI